MSELREHRNSWAHQKPFSGDDTIRMLDSSTTSVDMAVSSKQASEVEKMKNELQRLRFEEQARSQRRRTTAAVTAAAASGLPAWRDVVNPHPDVASGHYQQAEFAADLWQVHLGEGSTEYRNPYRILPPHLPDPKSEGSAGKWTAAPERPGRRARRAAADQLRRRQDPLHARPLSPVFGRAARRAGRYRRHHANCRSDRTAAGQPRRPRRQPHLARQPMSPSRTAHRCAPCGASLPGNWAMPPAATAKRALPTNACAPTTRKPPTPATPSVNC